MVKALPGDPICMRSRAMPLLLFPCRRVYVFPIALFEVMLQRLFLPRSLNWKGSSAHNQPGSDFATGPLLIVLGMLGHRRGYGDSWKSV